MTSKIKKEEGICIMEDAGRLITRSLALVKAV
jgi:hypothetical protein